MALLGVLATVSPGGIGWAGVVRTGATNTVEIVEMIE